MAYWGYKTPLNFAMWVVVIVLLVTGTIWIIVGGYGCALCEACRLQYGRNLTEGVDPRSVDNDCKVRALGFQLDEPEMTRVPDSRRNFYSWCIRKTGPVDEIVAGGVMFIVGVVLLSVFCCAPPPKIALKDDDAPASAAVQA